MKFLTSNLCCVSLLYTLIGLKCIYYCTTCKWLNINMMTKFLLLICGLLVYSTLLGQELTTSTILASGNTINNNGITINVSVGEAVIDFCANGVSSLNIGFNNPSMYELKGNLQYDNQSLTPLQNSIVLLVQNNQVVRGSLTNSNGYFHITDLLPGFYVVSGSSSLPLGGLNSVDALLILKHFVNLTPLYGLKIKAGDLDGSGVINSVDALMVTKRFVGMIFSFPVGDWQFEKPELQITSPGIYILNHKGICSGDVNGDHIP